MTSKQFSVFAHISTTKPAKVRKVLVGLVGRGSIERTEDGFMVRATMTGESADDLNREFLQALRRVEHRTWLQAEWTSGHTREHFFDYAPKGTREA